MKNILHLYADNVSSACIDELVTRTEGSIHNITVAIATKDDNKPAPVSGLHSPTPCDPSSLFHFDKMVAETAAFIEQNVHMEEIGLIHAHSVWPGGAVALELHRRHAIPYIAAVDFEDIRFWADNPQRGRKTAVPVLLQTLRTIFHDRNHQDFVANRLSNEDSDRIFSHALSICDGIDPFWFQNLHIHKPVSMVHTRLLLAGADLQPKSVTPVKKAIQLLHKKNYNVSLNVMGCNIADSTNMHVIPTITRDALFQEFRNNDIYIVPSFKDTARPFYAEALSQGLPIIHNMYEAPEGLCPDGKIGYAADLHSADDLAEKILYVGERFATIEQHITDLQPLQIYNWDEIYRIYLRVYEENAKF